MPGYNIFCISAPPPVSNITWQDLSLDRAVLRWHYSSFYDASSRALNFIVVLRPLASFQKPKCQPTSLLNLNIPAVSSFSASISERLFSLSVKMHFLKYLYLFLLICYLMFWMVGSHHAFLLLRCLEEEIGEPRFGETVL